MASFCCLVKCFHFFQYSSRCFGLVQLILPRVAEDDLTITQGIVGSFNMLNFLRVLCSKTLTDWMIFLGHVYF